MSSPWDAVDDEVQSVLRPIFELEVGNRVRPLQEAEHDRQLAAQIKRLSGKYKDFGPRQAEIIRFALQRRLPDLEVAYHAHRGLTGAATPPASAKPDQDADTGRQTRQARLEELRFRDDMPSQMERTKLQNEEDEDREQRARQMFRTSNVNDRQALAQEINERRASNAAKGLAPSSDDRNAEMDLDAIDLLHGKAPQPKRKASPSGRGPDKDGFDANDRALLSVMRERNKARKTQPQPNAEDVIRRIAEAEGR